MIEPEEDDIVVQNWKEENGEDTLERKLPDFQISNMKRKWGMTQTEVIGISCAEKDAKYLKHRFSKAGALKN